MATYIRIIDQLAEQEYVILSEGSTKEVVDLLDTLNSCDLLVARVVE